MRGRTNRCSYVVPVDPKAGRAEVETLARLLSDVGAAGCEVLILDSCPQAAFEERHRILRWVGRHDLLNGSVDLMRAAVDLASSEKVIVASPEARCTRAELFALCRLLDSHEVVQPQEYVDPMPWWGGVEAAGLLLQRGIHLPPEGRSIFAFRKSAFRPLRGYDDLLRDSDLRRLIIQGADVHDARDIFVRLEPPRLITWLRARAREIGADLSLPLKATFFLGLIPILVFLALVGGMQLAAGYASVMAFAAVMLAVRGRVGAATFYPWHACLYAPLWLATRSIIVYWALFDRMRSRGEAARAAAAHHGPQPEAAGRSH